MIRDPRKGDPLDRRSPWGELWRAAVRSFRFLPPLYGEESAGQVVARWAPPPRLHARITARAGTAYSWVEVERTLSGWIPVPGGRAGVTNAYELNRSAAVPTGAIVWLRYMPSGEWRFDRPGDPIGGDVPIDPSCVGLSACYDALYADGWAGKAISLTDAQGTVAMSGGLVGYPSCGFGANVCRPIVTPGLDTSAYPYVLKTVGVPVAYAVSCSGADLLLTAFVLTDSRPSGSAWTISESFVGPNVTPITNCVQFFRVPRHAVTCTYPACVFGAGSWEDAGLSGASTAAASSVTGLTVTFPSPLPTLLPGTVTITAS